MSETYLGSNQPNICIEAPPKDGLRLYMYYIPYPIDELKTLLSTQFGDCIIADNHNHFTSSHYGLKPQALKFGISTP